MNVMAEIQSHVLRDLEECVAVGEGAFEMSLHVHAGHLGCGFVCLGFGGEFGEHGLHDCGAVAVAAICVVVAEDWKSFDFYCAGIFHSGGEHISQRPERVGGGVVAHFAPESL